MAKTNIELYEALKAPVGDKAARMIAEVVPAADDLATKADVSSTRTGLAAEIAATRADLSAEIAATRTDLSAEIAATRTDLRAEIAATRTDLSAEIADLRTEMHREFSQMKGWMFASMVPLWLGVYGTLVTMIVFLLQAD